jgi:hypothetical protein
MSYDYLMFHRPGPWPQWVKRLQVFFTGDLGSLGTPEELMRRIDELFPQTRWRKMDRSQMRVVMPGQKRSGFDPEAPVWFGGSGPEFQLVADVDGKVKSLSVSRAERREIRLLCRKLGLVYLDLQAEGLVGMLFR